MALKRVGQGGHRWFGLWALWGVMQLTVTSNAAAMVSSTADAVASPPLGEERLPNLEQTNLEQQVQQTRQIIDQISSPKDQLTLILQLVDTLSRGATGSPPALPDAEASLDGLLRDAADSARQQPPEARTEAWLAIAERSIALGRRTEALNALAQASSHIDTLESPLTQAQQLQHIAAQLADLLEPSRAMAALQQAEGLLTQPLSSAQQAAILTSLAIQYADLGQQAKGAALLAQAQTLTDLEDPPSSPPSAPKPSTPLVPQLWDGSVGLQGNLFSGESSRGVIALNADVDRQWERTALDLGLQLTYNIDDDVDDPDQFSARFTADAQHYIARNWQYFVNSSVASDDLENLQLRATLFNGVGVTLLRSGDRELGLRTGVGVRYENFEEESSDFNSPSLSVGLTYRDRLLDLVQVRQSLDFDAPFGDVSDYLFRSQTSLRIPISDRWSFDQGLRLTLSGESAPDNPGLLLNLQTGLRYQF